MDKNNRKFKICKLADTSLLFMTLHFPTLNLKWQSNIRQVCGSEQRNQRLFRPQSIDSICVIGVYI